MPKLTQLVASMNFCNDNNEKGYDFEDLPLTRVGHEEELEDGKDRNEVNTIIIFKILKT